MSKDETPKGTGTPGDAEEFEVTYEAEVELSDDEVRSLAMEQANYQGEIEKTELQKAGVSAELPTQTKP